MRRMNLKDDLAELTLLLEKPDPKTASDKELLAAKLLPLIGLVQDEDLEVPADVFASLSNEGRKLALASLASVLIQTLEL
jgi:hypothetical protein